jgi:hypothetical protein
MTKHFLDVADVAAVLNQQRGEGVAEHVSREFIAVVGFDNAALTFVRI